MMMMIYIYIYIIVTLVIIADTAPILGPASDISVGLNPLCSVPDIFPHLESSISPMQRALQLTGQQVVAVLIYVWQLFFVQYFTVAISTPFYGDEYSIL